MRTVTAAIDVSAGPARTLAAFLDPDDLGAWWGAERSLVEPRAGGIWALAWGVTSAGFQYLTTGIIGQYEPGRVLLIDHYTYFNPARAILGPMRLILRVAPEGHYTRLSLVQEGTRGGRDWDWYHDAALASWPVALRALAEHLAREAGAGGMDRTGGGSSAAAGSL